MHAALAWRRGPHWLLNDADAKAYGLALTNALRHLPITAAQKTIDYSAFAVAVFAFEGPRLAMDMQLRRDRVQPPPRGPAQQVFEFRPNGAAGRPPAAPSSPPPPPGPAGDMTYEPELAG